MNSLTSYYDTMKKLHIGIISAPNPGHLYPISSFAQYFIELGHIATVYNIIDAAHFVRNQNINFKAIGVKEYPKGSWTRKWDKAAKSSNFATDFGVLKVHIEISKIMLSEIPDLLLKDKVDFLIVDHLQPQGRTISELVSIPYITFASTLTLYPDYSGLRPPILFGTTPAKSLFRRLWYIIGHYVESLLSKYYLIHVNNFARRHSLGIMHNIVESFSSIMEIGLVPKELDFPNPQIPAQFRYIRFLPRREKRIDFPWEKIQNNMLIYVSFGTIRNKFKKLYAVVINALDHMDNIQVIISKGAWHGNGIDINCHQDKFVVVDYAPQQEILKKATICITHAGTNTIIECIKEKVPMLAIPLADDQQSMAARVQFQKIGEVLSLRKLNENSIQEKIDLLLDSKLYRENISNLCDNIKKQSDIHIIVGDILKRIESIQILNHGGPAPIGLNRLRTKE
jgi:MGT family glycosyltransferase